MKKMIFLVLFLMTVASTLYASVLTFDIDGLPNGHIMSSDYGDRVACSQMGIFHYGLESGITPNVTVAYAGDRTWSDFPTFWAAGYNDLYNVIENESDGDTGYQVYFSGRSQRHRPIGKL